MKSKICFYARADRLFFYVPIAKKIEENQDYDFFFVTESDLETQYVKDNIPEANIYCLYEWLDTHEKQATLTELTDLEKRYSEYSIWRLLYSDRFLVHYSYEQCCKIIYEHFRFFEFVMETEKPNFLLNEAIATFGSYVAYVVGQHWNCKYMGAIIDRTCPYQRFFAFDNDTQLSAEMKERYEKNMFPETAVACAKTYYKEFVSKDIKLLYMEKDKVPRFTWKCVFAPVSYINRRRLLRKSKFANPNHYIEYRRPWNDRIYMNWERWFRFVKAKKYYQEPDFNQSYYLFPLHFQPEATTLICAEKYEKQIIAIDHIAKSLPLGSMLYVKEHYACLGHRKLSFYKQLEIYPNVKLITPFANIHELIRNSKAVIVLTSTTGFEAILHKKRVFILGDVFYQFSKNATKLSDVFNEWEKLRNTDVDDSEEEVIRFLSAYFAVLKTGNQVFESPGYASAENITKLYHSYLGLLKEAEKNENNGNNTGAGDV